MILITNKDGRQAMELNTLLSSHRAITLAAVVAPAALVVLSAVSAYKKRNVCLLPRNAMVAERQMKGVMCGNTKAEKQNFLPLIVNQTNKLGLCMGWVAAMYFLQDNFRLMRRLPALQHLQVESAVLCRWKLHHPSLPSAHHNAAACNITVTAIMT